MVSLKKIFKTVILHVRGRFFVFMGFILVFTHCKKDDKSVTGEVYEGPTIAIDSVYTEMSDEGKIIVKLEAPKQLDFSEGDREWPKGLSLQYLNMEGEITSTLKADYVYYTFKEKLYRAEGNVEVKNMKNGDELNTEELFWEPDEEKFFTERFVTIRSEDEVHTGEGLTANQDFTSYEILKPAGTISVLDE